MRTKHAAMVSGVGLVLAGAVGSGCTAVDFLNSVGKEQLDIPRMEAEIRSRLQDRLQSRSTAESVASVSRLRCRQRSESSATCFARVGRPRKITRLRIEVSVDPETGEYTWEVVERTEVRAKGQER